LNNCSIGQIREGKIAQGLTSILNALQSSEGFFAGVDESKAHGVELEDGCKKYGDENGRHHHLYQSGALFRALCWRAIEFRIHSSFYDNYSTNSAVHRPAVNLSIRYLAARKHLKLT
jgi:hypothetical protein